MWHNRYPEAKKKKKKEITNKCRGSAKIKLSKTPRKWIPMSKTASCKSVMHCLKEENALNSTL